MVAKYTLLLACTFPVYTHLMLSNYVYTDLMVFNDVHILSFNMYILILWCLITSVLSRTGIAQLMNIPAYSPSRLRIIR